jgi:hypothetical protein
MYINHDGMKKKRGGGGGGSNGPRKINTIAP